MKLTRNILAILLLLTTMLSLCAPFFALSASAASATSAPQAGEYYRLKNKKTQTYLTETEDTTFDPPYDTRRIVLDEKRSSDTQLFTISSASEGVDRFEFLISLSTGKALHRTARSDTRIANANCVITFTYSPGYIEERWYIQEAEDGYYRILSRDSVARGPVSQYLTATEFKNPVYEDKTDLTAAPLTDDDSQLWYFEKETVEADKNDVQPLPGYPLYDITPAEVLKPYLYTRIAAGDAKIGGYVGEALDFIYQEQVLAIDWKMLVNQFRYQTDNASNGWQQWKTEFFGKLMRGATWYYNYTGDEALYEELTAAVMDLLSTQEENGRISGYPIDGEFVVHDIWCRKYTMLGLQYYYDICKDEDMKAYVLRCLSIHADYILTKIGPEADKISILAGELEGLSATSILEPFVKLYKMTGYQRYLDFAAYIVESGGYTRGNIFEAAYEGTLSPYQYTTSPHGYAMSSCFAGLAEYYSVTGEEKWLIALVNYVNAIIRDEVTVIGSGGASGPPMNWSPEWWNNTAAQQANPSLVQMQETCTTAAWMQLLEKVLAFTEDSKLMDELEKSLYNALLGAMQGEDAEVEGACASLCWDYFSPLYGTRNNDFPGHIHGVDSCCNANGLTGLSMIPFLSVMNGPLGPVVNLYNEAVIKANTPSGKKVTLRFDTEYPIKGDITITLSLESAEAFTVMLRIPSYSKTTVVKVNGVSVPNVVPGEYLAIERSWKNGDTVELLMDMNTYVVECADGAATDAGEYIALVRGPITLARDARFDDGYILDGSDIKIDEKGCANVTLSETQSFRNHMEFLVETEDGKTIRMTDYASAGSTWTKESLYATWLLSEAPPELSENTEYRIICKADSALLTATTGDNVNREAASEGANQIWTLEKSGEGFYIKNVTTGKYLTAAGNENWSNVFVSDEKTLWKIETRGGSYFAIVLADGGNLASGSGNDDNIHMWEDGGSTLQHWSFVDINAPEEHIHTAQEGWKSNASVHYTLCACGETMSEAAHTWKTVTDQPATASQTGSQHRECTVCAYQEAATAIDKLAPTVVQGQNATFVKGSDQPLTVKSDAAFADFEAVLVDGTLLSETQYTVSEGSIVVVLKAEYLETLGTGEHTVTVRSLSGDASTTFTVSTATEDTTDTTDTTDPIDTTDPTDKQPLNGDNSGLWVTVVIVAIVLLAGAALVLIFVKKHKA